MALVREMRIEGAVVRIWDDCCASLREEQKRAVIYAQQQAAHNILAKAAEKDGVTCGQTYELPQVSVVYDCGQGACADESRADGQDGVSGAVRTAEEKNK